VKKGSNDLRRRLEEQRAASEWRPVGANAYLIKDIASHIRDAAQGLAPGGWFLDVGCGTGAVVAQLSADLHGRRAVGIDLVQRSRIDPRVEFILADARTLPLRSSSFDLTLVMTVLSSIPEDDNRRQVLREALRVTKPGGVLLVYDFLVKNPTNRFTRPVSVSQLRDELSDTDFAIRRVTLNPLLARLVFALPLRSPERWCDRLERWSALRHHILVRVVKSDVGSSVG
jgi:ubiquinone/menaquinone biosynthesis C-methylase UbiE